MTLGYDVDKPWRELPKKDRDWILFTDEQPHRAGLRGLHRRRGAAGAASARRSRATMGTFTSAEAARAAHLRQYAERADEEARCAVHARAASARSATASGCAAKSLSVKFAGLDIADIAALPLETARRAPAALCRTARRRRAQAGADIPRSRWSSERIAEDLSARLAVLLDLGLGYLSLERSTPTLSPGELQRLRLATQVRSNLFGVVYVLDEPSAGLHPADTEALLRALDALEGVRATRCSSSSTTST